MEDHADTRVKELVELKREAENACAALKAIIAKIKRGRREHHMLKDYEAALAKESFRAEHFATALMIILDNA